LETELEESFMSENTHVLAEVIPIGRHPALFPRHAEARHFEHGWVIVEEVDDNQRLVRWYVFEEVPECEFDERFGDEPIVDAHDISSFTEWVDISSLRQVDERDRPNDWQSLQRFGVLRRPHEIRMELERRAEDFREAFLLPH
jgi:hypothetical protein